MHLVRQKSFERRFFCELITFLTNEYFIPLLILLSKASDIFQTTALFANLQLARKRKINEVARGNGQYLNFM